MPCCSPPTSQSTRCLCPHAAPAPQVSSPCRLGGEGVTVLDLQLQQAAGAGGASQPAQPTSQPLLAVVTSDRACPLSLVDPQASHAA
jgi:hypothetical protein